MDNKENELRLYTKLDLKNAYREGVRDKISFLAVIAAALLAASVVGTVVGKVIPPILEAVFNSTVPNEVNN